MDRTKAHKQALALLNEYGQAVFYLESGDIVAITEIEEDGMPSGLFKVDCLTEEPFEDVELAIIKLMEFIYNYDDTDEVERVSNV